MEYKDSGGNILYGYSQKDLNETIMQQKRTNSLIMLLISVLFLFLLLVLYIVWQVESRDILANAINTLARCA